MGQPTVVFPGFDGGAEWGGQAFDQDSGLLYVNANDLAWTGALAPSPPPVNGGELFTAQCAACHREGGAGPSLADVKSRRTPEQITEVIQKGSGRMPGFPNLPGAAVRALVQFAINGSSAPVAPTPFDMKYRFTGYNKFLDPDGYPAVATPWGTLNAINLNTGEYAWKIPFGEYPELAEKGIKDTGSENYGGPIVTAGGLVFIAATNHDRKFRAFDKDTGKLLWETLLPSSGNSTPATYEVGGKQYVVIPATGEKSRTRGGPTVYVAFTLAP